MKLADRYKILEISTKLADKQITVYPTLLLDDPVILVDTGYPGQLPQIHEAIEKAGIAFSKLNKVILTHHDIDHMGNAKSLENKLPLEVLAHEAEKPYIEGKLPSPRLSRHEALQNIMPEEINRVHEKLKTFFDLNKIKLSDTLTDGQILPCCGGITIIHTPGHTLGHISLYLRRSKTLIAGDNLVIDKGILTTALEFTILDMNLYIKSLYKLTNYDIETVICYHGGLYKENVNERIAELAFNQVNKQCPENLIRKFFQYNNTIF